MYYAIYVIKISIKFQQLSNKCSLCDQQQQPINFVTQPSSVNQQIPFQYSNHKNRKQSPLKISYQSHTKKKTQNLNIYSSTKEQNNNIQYALICKKHDEVQTFYNIHNKNLLCASCLYYHTNKKSHSNISNTQLIYNHGTIIPLKNSVDILRNQIKNHLQQLKDYSSKIDQSLRCCRHSKTIIQTNYNSILEQVSNASEYMIKQIRNREKQFKIKIVEYLNNKLDYYGKQQAQLIKYKEFIKDMKLSSNGINKKSQKVQQIASIYETSKQLRKALNQLNFDKKSFGLAQLNVLKFNKKMFQSVVQNTFKLANSDENMNRRKTVNESSSIQRMQKSSKSNNNGRQMQSRQIRKISYLNLLHEKSKKK